MTPEKKRILDTINLLQAQRHILGDAAVDEALAALNQSLDRSETVGNPTVADMEGERKLVTIMFADLSNFTSMFDKMDAEDIRTLMNNCFSKLVPIIEQHGGKVDKFIGDEIMALFGAPHAHDNDAECALRASLDMMHALADFNVEHKTNLGLHFGINTGLVVTGGVGSTKVKQYSVIGDPVNLASRFEDASVTGEILVGYDTFKLTSNLFDFEERAPLSVKGKEKPVPVYRLLSLKTAPQSARGLAGLHSEMIGREESFQVLISAIEKIKNNQGKIIALVGEPGIGKSRMLNEFQKTGIYSNWIEGRGQFFSQNVSYGLAKSLLDQALGIPPHASIQDSGDILLDFLIKESPDKVNELYPYLARLRGITLDEATDSLHQAVTPEVMQRRIRAAFCELLTLRSHGLPTVLVWEDIHWADASSLQLIEYLFEWVRNKPFLILLTFRSHEGLVQEYQPRWIEAFMDYQAIGLEPLTESDSNRLVDNLLQIEDLPEKTRDILFQKAEGNPFYLEELLRSLLEMEVLYWQNGNLRLKHEIDQLKIPNTLQGVIEARIDRLLSAEKSTLQAASVIGRVFGKEILERLVDQGKSGTSLLQTLPVLEERELIQQRILLDYIFKHAVTQDVTYNSLRMARRQELHQFVGDAIESLFPTQTDEHSESLAWHFQRAKNHKKAINYLSVAADKSRLRFSYHESEHYYREALKEIEMTPDHSWETKVNIHENLGEILVLMGRFDEGRHAYADAIVNVASGEKTTHARLLRKTGESYTAQRRPDQEILNYDLAITVLGNQKSEQSDDWNHEWLEIQLARIWSLYWLNRVPEMKQMLEAIQPVCENNGTIRQQSIWHGRWILVYFRTEQYDIKPSHLLYVEKAMVLSQNTKDHKLIAYHAGILGMALYCAKENERVEKQLFLAIESAHQVGDTQLEVVGLQFLNLFYLSQGNVKAVRKYAPIMEEKARNKVPFYLFSVQAFYSWLAWKENNLVEAEKHALEALKIHNKAPVPNSFAKWPLVAIFISKQRYDEAIPHLKDMLLPFQMKLQQQVGDLVVKALDLWEKGETDAAKKELNNVLATAQAHHYL